MNDIKDQPRPRKILGMNSKLSAAASSPSKSDLNYSENRDKILQVTSMDRMRFPSTNSQELPSIWPYAAFLSPILPAPNMALQYALAPNVQYAALPFITQAIANGPTVGANGGNHPQQQQQQNIGTRDPEKMTIQIGVQCVNQNNPININAMNDMTASIGKINLQVDPSESGIKEEFNLRGSPSVPMRNPNKDSRIIKEHSSILGGGGGDPNDVVINTFEILKSLALSGSETAEKLAYTHRNRPCFKKIDSLCARLKQDLVRPDGVLPNINSQGIAWAVKDFIFVFTRVMNAWIIIKGYVYNTPEGLNKVRSALSPEFVRSFTAWQETTVSFMDNLIQSFINLDNLVQSQKNVYQKANNSTPMKASNDDSFEYSSSPVDEFVGLNKEPTATQNTNYTYTMVEDSDLTQRENAVNGTYFKTGTYNFIKRESLGSTESLTPTTTGIEQLFDETLAKTLSNISSVYDLLPSLKAQSDKKLNFDIRVLENKLSMFSNDFDPNVEKPLGKDLVNKLNVLIERLMKMKNGDIFFKIQFCQNYFPDFIAQTPEFMDIREIILKCQTGAYGHIFEVVHDIRLIIYQTKEYLKKNLNGKLVEAVNMFEEEVEMIFAQEPFENYNFDHIKGTPNEILYNSGKY
ncbi:protein mitoshell-like [Eupeodes corollae]|uniref:protein mitoshell-like n=1 Tax=Eupeodes corollae TaxID=290404 RepID=UPI002490906F|nr:protein mitoshell-like [Eupeodes corollae]